jgi:hypothetical protein
MRQFDLGGCAALAALGCFVGAAWSENVIQDPEFVAAGGRIDNWKRAALQHPVEGIDPDLEAIAYERAAHVAHVDNRAVLRLIPTYFMNRLFCDGSTAWAVGDVNEREFLDDRERLTVSANYCDVTKCDRQTQFQHEAYIRPVYANVQQGALELGSGPWMQLRLEARAIAERSVACLAGYEERRALGIADHWMHSDLPVLEVRIKEWNRAPNASESDAWTNPGSTYQCGEGENLHRREAIYLIRADALIDTVSGAPSGNSTWRTLALNYKRLQNGDLAKGSPWSAPLADRRYQVELHLPVPAPFTADALTAALTGPVQVADVSRELAATVKQEAAKSLDGPGSGGGQTGGGLGFNSLPFQAEIQVDSVFLTEHAMEPTFSDVGVAGDHGMMARPDLSEDPIRCPSDDLHYCLSQFGCHPQVSGEGSCSLEWPDHLDRILMGTWDHETSSAGLHCPYVLCPADLNGDQVVNGADLGVLLGSWGVTNPGGRGDLNGDGTVNGADLGILLGSWGGCT